MFDSGIAASNLISTLKAEVDVAIPISNRSYVDSLNSLEQLLYTEVIKEQAEGFLTPEVLPTSPQEGHLYLDDILLDSNANSVLSDDVYAVWVHVSDDNYIQLKETSLSTAPFIDKSWYRVRPNGPFELDKIVVRANGFLSAQYRLVYFIRPALKTVNSSDVVGSGNVMLPVEFIDLAKAKLRADAYKIANEDALAAKWLNDYNVLLETFKQWIEQKRPHFGI